MINKDFWLELSLNWCVHVDDASVKLMIDTAKVVAEINEAKLTNAGTKNKIPSAFDVIFGDYPDDDDIF